MSGSDDFDDFLARRKPLFRRPPDDVLEPPADLDRIVLRQARDAIRRETPEPAYHGTRWGMPIALAASVLVAATIVLNLGMPDQQPVAEVTVQNVTRQMDSAAALPAAAAESAVAPRELTASNAPPPRVAPPAPEVQVAVPATAPARTAARTAPGQAPAAVAMQESSAAPAAAAGSAPVPDWRRDQRSWLAEIERLRAAGMTAQADAELAEFKRQNRAYAVSPDR